MIFLFVNFKVFPITRLVIAGRALKWFLGRRKKKRLEENSVKKLDIGYRVNLLPCIGICTSLFVIMVWF